MIEMFCMIGGLWILLYLCLIDCGFEDCFGGDRVVVWLHLGFGVCW